MTHEEKVATLSRIIMQKTGATNVKLLAFHEAEKGIQVSYSCAENPIDTCSMFITWWSIAFA